VRPTPHCELPRMIQVEVVVRCLGGPMLRAVRIPPRYPLCDRFASLSSVRVQQPFRCTYLNLHGSEIRAK
jgi:hypothetical protein